MLIASDGKRDNFSQVARIHKESQKNAFFPLFVCLSPSFRLLSDRHINGRILLFSSYSSDTQRKRQAMASSSLVCYLLQTKENMTSPNIVGHLRCLIMLIEQNTQEYGHADRSDIQGKINSDSPKDKLFFSVFFEVLALVSWQRDGSHHFAGKLSASHRRRAVSLEFAFVHQEERQESSLNNGKRRYSDFAPSPPSIACNCSDDTDY